MTGMSHADRLEALCLALIGWIRGPRARDASARDFRVWVSSCDVTQKGGHAQSGTADPLPHYAEKSIAAAGEAEQAGRDPAWSHGPVRLPCPPGSGAACLDRTRGSRDDVTNGAREAHLLIPALDWSGSSGEPSL
ncbi:unnamed protein product [Merluccius merluccius]